MTSGFTRIQIPFNYQQKIKQYAKEWKVKSNIISSVILRHNVGVYEKAKVYKLLKQYNYIKRR